MKNTKNIKAERKNIGVGLVLYVMKIIHYMNIEKPSLKWKNDTTSDIWLQFSFTNIE